MKRFLSLYVLLFFCLCTICAQTEQVRVTLKKGVAITGELKEMDPINYVEVIVAGTTTKILASEIESIETSIDTRVPTPDSSDCFAALPSNLYGDYIITDKGVYPEQYVVEVDNQKITMVHIRGGVFNMGYDGSRSILMDSEPVHKVAVSSFYVSKEYLNSDVAYALLNEENNSKSIKYCTSDWDEAKKVVDIIAEQKSAPYRLLTEAEWEYIAIGPKADTIFFESIDYNKDLAIYHVGEWCSDFWAKFSPQRQINPQGRITGTIHVARSYALDRHKWNRDKDYHDLNNINISQKPAGKVPLYKKNWKSSQEKSAEDNREDVLFYKKDRNSSNKKGSKYDDVYNIPEKKQSVSEYEFYEFCAKKNEFFVRIAISADQIIDKIR